MTSAVSLPISERYGFPPSPVRRFSVDEYHQLIEGGFFAEGERIELLEGWLVAKARRNPIHDATVAIAMESIRLALPPGWRARGQSAVTLSDSEPEPDLAVVRGEPRDYLEHHPRPADIALIVEVANSSLDEDRDLKYRVYARAGILNYWIINLIDNRVEVYSDPSGSVAEPFYRARADYGVGQFVPLSVGSGPSVSIAVRDLIP